MPSLVCLVLAVLSFVVGAFPVTRAQFFGPKSRAGSLAGGGSIHPVTATWTHEKIVVSVKVTQHDYNELGRKQKRLTREIPVSIAYIKFDRGVQIHRSIDASKLVNDASFFPESQENAEGLTELTCMKNQAFPSRLPSRGTNITRRNRQNQTERILEWEELNELFLLNHEIPTNTFIPGDMISTSALTWLASAITQNSMRIHARSNREVLGVLFRGNDEQPLSNCSLHFLSHEEQRERAISQGVSMDRLLVGQYEDESGTPLFGAVMLVDTEPSSSSLLWPLRDDVYSATAAAATALQVYEKVKVEYEHHNCVPIPRKAESMAGVTELLQTGSKTGLSFPDEQIADDMPGLVKGVVIMMIEPILKLLGVFMGNSLMPPLMDDMTQMTDGSLVGALNEQLMPKLVLDLQRGIPPGVQAAVPETVTQAVAEMMQVYVKGSVAETVATSISDRVAESLRHTVPRDTEELVSDSIASEVTKNAVHSLTRSLTHSIVPALTHTMTHNPMTDYYCNYCFKHKTYCQYCSYAPQQLYYATFYAGFYSTYFSDYYNGGDSIASPVRR